MKRTDLTPTEATAVAYLDDLSLTVAVKIADLNGMINRLETEKLVLQSQGNSAKAMDLGMLQDGLKATITDLTSTARRVGTLAAVLDGEMDEG